MVERVSHVFAGRVDPAFGDERDDRRDQGVAELAGDRLGRESEDHVVLAGGEVGPVLLDAAGGDDRRELAGPHGVANLDPGHVFHEDGIRAGIGRGASGSGRIGSGVGTWDAVERQRGQDDDRARHGGDSSGTVRRGRPPDILARGAAGEIPRGQPADADQHPPSTSRRGRGTSRHRGKEITMVSRRTGPVRCPAGAAHRSRAKLLDSCGGLPGYAGRHLAAILPRDLRRDERRSRSRRGRRWAGGTDPARRPELARSPDALGPVDAGRG